MLQRLVREILSSSPAGIFVFGHQSDFMMQNVETSLLRETLAATTCLSPPHAPSAVCCLRQSMLASDVQSLMSDVLNLVSRVPIEALWPQHQPSKALATAAGRTRRARPKTYGEAYRSLLEDRDLLALGIHRPPTGGRGNGPLSAATGGSDDDDDDDDDDAARNRRCPGGSRYVAITCPSASFPVQDGDCFFVLRRPNEADEEDNCITASPVGTV